MKMASYYIYIGVSYGLVASGGNKIIWTTINIHYDAFHLHYIAFLHSYIVYSYYIKLY